MALLAAYSFDESGDTVKDYSGNGNDFSLTGTTAVRDAAGHTNGGLKQTGATSPVLPDIGRTANRTVMAWMSNISTQPDSWAIIFNTPSIDSGAWGILNLTANLHIQARNSSGFARASAAEPADANFHHVAGTYDGSTIRLYIDGTLAASTALAGPLRTDTDPPKLMSGWGNIASVMDDLRLYDEALSEAAIQDAMNTPVTTSSTTGVLAATSLLQAGDLSGTVTADGSLSGTGPLTDAALVGNVLDAGTLDASLPLPLASVIGTTPVAGKLEGTLPLPQGLFIAYERVWEYPPLALGDSQIGASSTPSDIPWQLPVALIHGIGCYSTELLMACEPTSLVPKFPRKCPVCGAVSAKDATGLVDQRFVLKPTGWVRVS